MEQWKREEKAKLESKLRAAAQLKSERDEQMQDQKLRKDRALDLKRKEEEEMRQMLKNEQRRKMMEEEKARNKVRDSFIVFVF